MRKTKVQKQENRKVREVMKKRIKDKKGITLIALVITIIVLLILAGVAISMLSGDNGILNRATDAKEKTKYGRIIEAKNLWETEKVADEYIGGTGTAGSASKVINELWSEGTITEEERDTLLEGRPIIIDGKQISFGKTLVDMYIAGESCTTEGCTDENHLHIGDYVSYNPSDGEEESTSVGKSETGYDATQIYQLDASTKWRVLGLSNDRKHVLLTSGSPIKKAKTINADNTEDTTDPYLVMQGAESYINCVSTLKKICNIYKNNNLADEVRSITIEDVNNVLGVVVEKDENNMPTAIYNSSDSAKTNIDLYNGVDSYIYKSGDFAPENYLGVEPTKVAGNVVYRTSYW